jgi:NADPH-dependent 2,4-dienoyl-CoA reductase/sulfur reductase-like enzyme/rhodanese-related sulfurtransferase
MSPSQRIVIIGAVAAGPKTAARIMRLDPEADVTLLEKGVFLSYAGCGLPYYVSGLVKSQEELMSTPAGALRDEVFFHDVKHIHVHNQTVATTIDRENKVVHADRCETGVNCEFPYDKLVLATGACPVRPPLPGADLSGILTLHGVEDAEEIKEMLARKQATDVVIVGGGLIGVEVTEALVQSGCRVTMVELLPEILTMLDADMAWHVRAHMESKGVRVLAGTKVTEFHENAARPGAVGEVVTVGADGSSSVLPADMVILSIGVRPNVDLARAAGLEIGSTGAIAVDEHLRSVTDPDVYAVGDCAEQRHRLTGKPAWVPLGSTANKQGRVAATDIAGGGDTFPGVLGTGICRVFDYCVARTGLTETEARNEGYDVVTTLAPGPDKPHFMPDAKMLMLKGVADRSSRKLLGLQAIGPGDGARRVDIAAMAISAGMTIDEVAKSDLSYAPPFSPAMDNLITACDVLRNKSDGLVEGLPPSAVKAALDTDGKVLLLDVRSGPEVAQVRIPGALHIPLGQLRERVDELPDDKRIIAYCKISLRGYEAALIAKAAGHADAAFMDGGIVMWPYEKDTAAPA